jgi:thioredoxin-dependent peroxiredoxin
MVEAGEKAPDFAVKDHEGKTVKLSDFQGKNVVLYFYPKDFTSGCTKESCDFRDRSGEFKNTVILGVSSDTVDSHEDFRHKYNLPFKLLSDPDQEVQKKYGVWGEKSMYGRTYMGTVRTTYLIGKDGKVAKVWNKVKVDGHVDEVLEATKSL